MGPVGHALAGLGIYFGYCIKTRRDPSFKGMAGSMLLAVSPDFDLIPALWTGFPKANMYHHSITHTIAFAAVVGVIPAIWRWITQGRFDRKLALLGFSLICIHIITDFFTQDGSFPYGVMPFWPITSKYFLGPSIFLAIHKGSWAQLAGMHNIKATIHEILIFTPILSVMAFHLFSIMQPSPREISK